MVKNRINTFILPVLRFFLASFLLAGCAEEELWEGKEGVPEGDGVGMVDIKLDVESMRDTDDLESKIHTLRLVAFRSADGTLKLNKRFDFHKDGYNPGTDNISEVITTGSTELCIIANETPEMTENLEKDDLNMATVRQQMFLLEDIDKYIVKDSLAKGIPMYAEYHNLGIKITHTKENPFSIKASLERVLAKITLTISNKTHKEITLESVTVKSLPAHSWLFSKDYTGATQDLAARALSLTNTPSATEKSEYDPVVMYIPEYILTKIGDRSYLEIIGKADVDGHKIDCSYTISLGNGLDKYNKEATIKEAITKKVITTADLSMLRNTHYQINVSDLKGYERDKMTFLIDITPWDSENIDVYEGGAWAVHPVSQRIPIRNSASFTAKFIHTHASRIVYKWYRSQYKQTVDSPTPPEPSIELLHVDTLQNGTESVYTFANSLPNASGEIFCEAAPLGGVNFRESNKSTLMVIGDWIPGDGEKEAYPPMQDWEGPKSPEGRAISVPLGASYLLRDTRDGKIYRTKLLADGNWWMIQELAYGNPSSLSDFVTLGLLSYTNNMIGEKLWGIACRPNSPFGGLLYNPFAAVQYEAGWPGNLNGTKSLSVQGLCPDGWHLPGNKNDKWSEEWVQLGDKMGKFSFDKLVNYEYQFPEHFNSYTHEYFIPSRNGTYEDFLIVDNKKCAYHAGIVMLRGEYSSIGFNYHEDLSQSLDSIERNANDGPNIDPQSEDAFPTNSGYPIRCIRNDK